MNLSESQTQVVENNKGPLIVVAGPGSGKTHTIVSKISKLVEDNICKKEEILALTFTQKATQEISSRVDSHIGGEFRAYTFHSFALEILDKYSKSLNHFPANYILIDESDSILYFKRHFEDFNLKSVQIKDKLQFAKEISSTISKLKDFGYSLKNLDKLECGVGVKVDLFDLYLKYEEWKKKNHFIDFGDLLLSVKNLFQSNKTILEEVRNRYKYVLVDEFQDCNFLQVEILDLLGVKDICVVGDFKQSIYSFRGSYNKIFEEFKLRFDNSKEIILKENYRNSKEVLNLVNLITNKIADETESQILNSKVKGKVDYFRSLDENCELNLIVERVQDAIFSKKSVGILTRRKSELKLVCEKFDEFGIDYLSSGVSSFFEDGLIEELVQILKFLQNPKERSIELFYMLERLNLSEGFILNLSRRANSNSKSLFRVITNLDSKFNDFEDEVQFLEEFVLKIKKLIEIKDSKLGLRNFILRVISEFGFYKRAIVGGEKRVLALNSFLNFCDNYVKNYKSRDFKKFIEYVEMSLDLNYSQENLSLKHVSSNVECLTIHQAKGKEFDVVIMPFLNQNKFPTTFKKPMFDVGLDLKKEDFLEEEKRLFFVGISRAKENLVLSFVKKFTSNKLESKKSDFLDLINFDNCDFLNYELGFNFNVSKNDEVKSELIGDLISSLDQCDFKKAKNLVGVYENLFSKKKSLSAFSNILEAEKYKNKLDSKEVKTSYDFSSHVYSVSQLKTYEQCPKKYLYSYVYKIPTPSKHYFDFGTTMHDVLENLLPLFSSMDVEKIKVDGLKMLGEKWISKSYDSEKQEREYFEKGVKAVENFVELEFKRRKEEKDRVCVEQEREFLIDIGENKKIIGYVDRIDRVGDDFEILDYKTSNSKMYKSQLKEDIQLYVYAYALNFLNEYKKFPKAMGLWYLIFNEIDMINFDRKILDSLLLKIKNLIGEIEKKNFPAKPSAFSCKYCDYSSICPNRF